MDLLGIAALGGLERIAIVAGAVIIGYWGYRLYTAEKNAGLIFMGLAVLVLIGALATGTNHLQRVSEDYQLASIPAVESATTGAALSERDGESPFVESAAESTDDSAESEDQSAPGVASAASDAAEPTFSDTAQSSPAETTPPAQAPADLNTALVDEKDTAPEASVSLVRRLATGQELGGRIVSVKSEKVSLEWTPEPESD